MKKTFTLLLFIFIFILVFTACQNTAPISNSMKTDGSTLETLSSIVTPKPKETKTPTVNPATKTAIVWDATSDAFFLTSKANTMIRKTSVIKTLSAKGIICKSGYKTIPLYDFPLIIDYYKTEIDSWTVLGCYNEDNHSIAYTEIINQDNTKHYTISQEGLNLRPTYFLTVFHLDPKNNILYLKSRSIYSGSGFDPYTYFGHGSDIYKFDLENGNIKIILPYSSNVFTGQTVFSPDLRMIALSTSDEPDKISFYDTATEKTIRTIALKGDFITIGAFNWSEDGKQMIFAAGHPGWDEEKNGIAIYQINTNTWKVQEIIDSDTLRLVPWDPEYGENIWLDENTISMIDIFTQDSYKLDIVTGELTEWKE